MAIGVYTDSTGTFLLPGVSSGACTLWVRRLLFQDGHIPCTVLSGRTIDVSVDLEADSTGPSPYLEAVSSPGAQAPLAGESAGALDMPGEAKSVFLAGGSVTLASEPQQYIPLDQSFAGFVNPSLSPWVGEGVYVWYQGDNAIYCLDLDQNGQIHLSPSGYALAPGYGGADPLFFETIPGGRANALILDMDGDGELEAAIKTADGAILYDEARTDTIPSSDSYFDSNALSAADLDGDGCSEFAFPIRDTLLIADRHGAAGEWSITRQAGLGYCGALRAVDMDLDGNDELLGWVGGGGQGNGLVAFDWSQGSGLSWKTLLPGAASSRMGVGVVDLDDDGDHDAIAFGHDLICWVESRPASEGGPYPHIVCLGGFSLRSMAFARLQGEMSVLLLAEAATNRPGQLSWWASSPSHTLPWVAEAIPARYLITWAPRDSAEGYFVSGPLMIHTAASGLRLEWFWHPEGTGDPDDCSVAVSLAAGSHADSLGEWSPEDPGSGFTGSLDLPRDCSVIEYRAVLRSSDPLVRPVLDSLRIVR
jgi:hypothetical protein